MEVTAGSLWKQVDRLADRLVIVVEVDDDRVIFKECDDRGNIFLNARPQNALRVRFNRGGYVPIR